MRTAELRVIRGAGLAPILDTIVPPGQALYVKLDECIFSGLSPISAIKTAQYMDGTEAGRLVATPKVVPIFIFNGSNNYRSVHGFFDIRSQHIPSSIVDSDVVVIKADAKINVFVKGSKTNSHKYIEYEIIHAVTPFDPTGKNVYGNQDVWRINGAYKSENVEAALRDSSFRSVMFDTPHEMS